MGIISEATQTQLQATLAAGLGTLSNQQQIIFQQYAKSVSVADGYVFWVATGNNLTATGSLHQITETIQDEDNTYAKNGIVFTSQAEVTQFNLIDPQMMWIGAWIQDDVTLRVVFNDSGSVYQQSGLWHYSGDTVYPALQSQLVSSEADLPVGPIVSNSLPIWLAQNTFAPVYPSYLVPDNLEPPYIVVHIEPESTETLGAFPVYQWPGVTAGTNDYQLPSSQLMKEKVKLTLYGFTNQSAIQYLSSLMDYSINTDDFGFMNSPAIRDEKRKQSEIAAIAMKKSIDILASYYQGTADAVARRLILSAAVTINI
ncbi:hypothetical protein [Ferrovum sp.]|uniref:hypothetical protein n=1 Tax=Ferrovum sp. TaxID=2609467 RepID=UPI002603C330|nr:hypothetical protein [Ferrovum sp.]